MVRKDTGGVQRQDQTLATDATLIPHLLSIAKSFRQLIDINLAECGVAAGQDQFLLCLAEEGDMSVVELATRLSVRPSTISKMADILSRKGWAERGIYSDDQRRVRLRLTDEGRAVATTVRNLHDRLDRELSKVVGEDLALLPILNKVDHVLSKRLRRLR
ncbi:MarR family winged helix-turn-helix transcriptional regulator [Aureimonas leprariae]|uniref:MarR family transcriptional regulator n=1 Tax=Plantimonas leprariae TaxID=2615207 RepID=A0A7V7PSE5_9HYPH|nr:MarR family transcriptional regulator [Aureimonas leprariae]KAB0682002.1 MarR family transcriptional regulator [Aureimonas leprariae]